MSAPSPRSKPGERLVTRDPRRTIGGRERPQIAMAKQVQPADVATGPDREIRVLVVDDHPGFREVLGDLIAASPGFVVAGVASSGEEAIYAVDELLPELVLMDVLMPGMGGIAATRAILKTRPNVLVLLTSIENPGCYPGVAELAGEVAFIRKQDLRPHLLRYLWKSVRERA